MTPWLLSGDAAPKAAHARLKSLRASRGQEAKTEAEALAMSDALLARVEDWNMAHPDEEIAAPAPVVVLNTRPPAWTAESLRELRDARRFQAGLNAAWRARSATTPLNPKVIAGLTLASALFDSACHHPRDLALFAVWPNWPEAAYLGV